MQSLMGKGRALQAFDDKRSSARFFRLACAPLPFVGSAAVVLSGGNVVDATFYAMVGWAIFIQAQNGVANTEFEILSQCVGRPRLAKAVAGRCISESRYRSLFERLGNLDRLNGTQKALLRDFFLLKSWQIPEEDWVAAQNLLIRSMRDPLQE